MIFPGALFQSVRVLRDETKMWSIPSAPQPFFEVEVEVMSIAPAQVELRGLAVQHWWYGINEAHEVTFLAMGQPLILNRCNIEADVLAIALPMVMRKSFRRRGKTREVNLHRSLSQPISHHRTASIYIP